MREAFLTALEAFVRSSPSTRLAPSPDVRRHTRRAAELIANSQYDNPATRNSSVHLVYIQALILMALESDNHGPATMRGQVGPPRAEWLGRAIGMATHLRLNIPRSRDRFSQEDADADDKLGRRIWWILFILDRWHASSTSCLQQLADSSSSLLPEDQILLGESTYHLASKSHSPQPTATYHTNTNPRTLLHPRPRLPNNAPPNLPHVLHQLRRPHNLHHHPRRNRPLPRINRINAPRKPKPRPPLLLARPPPRPPPHLLHHPSRPRRTRRSYGKYPQ